MSELSAGVQILIAQLKTNPDEFFGPVNDRFDPANYLAGRDNGSPKFRKWASVIEDDLLKIDNPNEKLRSVTGRAWFLTPDEKAALVAAYTEARRVRFDAEVIAALTAQPQEKGYGAQPGQGTIVGGYMSTTQATNAGTLTGARSIG